MQLITVNVSEPDELLDGFGAGALIRIERDSAADFATSVEVELIPLESETVIYQYWDPTGVATDYYRVRYSTATPTSEEDYSDYSQTFQVGGTAEYATVAELKQLLNITDTTDDDLLAVMCERVNSFIESETKQPVAPIPSATYLYDVEYWGRDYGNIRIFLPMPTNAPTLGIGGMRAVSLVEVGGYTGDTFATVATTDWFLRGRRGVNGPYQWLIFSDRPVGTYTRFSVGRGTVRVTGTAGWEYIPPDLTMAALEIAKNAWNARRAGYQDAVDDGGAPIVARLVSAQQRATLRNYRLRMPY